jgi:VWFA-related protein
MSKSHLCCLALPLFSVVVAFSQQNPATVVSSHPDSASAPAAMSGEGRIKLDAVVTDKSGKPVSGLGPSDFSLLDNNQPGRILSFHAVDGMAQQADPPAEVILLIDAENLGFRGVSIECEQIKRFLRQNSGHLAQPVSIWVLTSKGLDVQPEPSLDGNALAVEVGQIEDRLRTTGPRAGNDGPVERFQFSVETLTAIADNEARRPGRKLLIWAGPGWPMFDSSVPPVPSRAQLQSFFKMIVQLSTRLREARITVYNVMLGTGLVSFHFEDFLNGVKTPENANTADLGLKVLAVQSGGRNLGPDNDLAGQINDCIQDASAFYTFSFDPPRAVLADEYHELKLMVDRPKLIVRTNTGYYNQPEVASKPANDNASSNSDANRVAARPVTVAQLEQFLKQIQGRPDAEAARQLSGLILTERLSSAKLPVWKAGLPGAKAQQEFVALADASAFLAPPAAEIPANAPPDLAAQRRMIAQTVDYLGRIIPKLPDFFATRLTAYYEETPLKSKKAAAAAPAGGPLHLVETFSATVLYRDGHEVVKKDRKSSAEAERLVIRGTFGPVLSVVIGDTVRSGMTWSRWEVGAAGPMAVFHFIVPKQRSHYRVASRGFLIIGEEDALQPYSGYHGEIAIDPATGTILRLTLEAEPESAESIFRAGIMVEYGPVVIGGQTYICPVRSVSISRGLFLPEAVFGRNQTPGPAMTMLNDVAFVDYHVFRSEVKMLSADDSTPEVK